MLHLASSQFHPMKRQQQTDVFCSLKRALMTGRLCPNRVKRRSVEDTESLQLTHLTLSAG
jgi:hypothetical protein